MGSKPSKNLADRPIVIVVGGGPAGIGVAQQLDSNFNVVVLERKAYYYHNIGALRAICDPAFAGNVIIPYKKALKNGHVVHAEVEKITIDGVHLLGVQDPVKFDYLIIATGTSYAFPAKVANPSAVQTKRMLEDAYKALKEASKIAIVGGGPVGIELAGEIKSFIPDKEVVLVHGDQKLLNDSMPVKFRDGAQKSLEKLGVKLHLGYHVDMSDHSDLVAPGSLTYFRGSRVLKLAKKGGEGSSSLSTIEADMVYICTGAHVNKKSFENTLPIDEAGRLKVNGFLQVEGHTNIFAVGDCGNVDETKLAYFAENQAKVAAANVQALDRKGALKKYVSGGKNTMILPCGPNGGISCFGGSVVASDFVCRMLKSRTLFAPVKWSQLHETYPKGNGVPVEDWTTEQKEQLKEKLASVKVPSAIAMAETPKVADGVLYT